MTDTRVGFSAVDAPAPSGDRLGLITGTSLRTDPFEDTDDLVVLRRHGAQPGDITPAHLVDHRENIRALCEAGCNRIVALASAGSLRPDWDVGTVVVPDDFLALQVAPSFFDDARGHSVPGFDLGWRRTILETWAEVTDTPVHDGGVYAQTDGPRFETPAEVRMLAAHADLVGMTLAAECILAREAGLGYAAICTVDNLANGIANQSLDVDEFRANVRAGHERLVNDLSALLPRLATQREPTPWP
jgi:5'-methylthioadenosine phosphorylase